MEEDRFASLEKSMERIEMKVDTLRKKKHKTDDENDFSHDENEERGNWTGKADFLLACLGYAVGLGNVWRFPYLCYKNGGGAFFIPYIIMLFLVGIPIFFLELSLGQFTSSGPLTCWKFAPIFTGIGAGMVIVSAIVAVYYNMIIAWAFYYLFASFTSHLPWDTCDAEWNTDFCSSKLMKIENSTECEAMMFEVRNGTCFNESIPVGIINKTLAATAGFKAVLPAEEYLNRRVLGRDYSEGLHDMGPLRWDLSLCLLLAWIIVFFSLVNGVKSSGKVVYFTALFPYVVLVVFFIQACLLEGFSEGVGFYLTPNLEILYSPEVWKDAAVQIFFSLSASWGGLITLASYNRFHTDTLRDSLIVCFGNCLTSFFAGFSVFGFLGYLSIQMDTPIEDVATGGVGLAFVIYPEAIIRMPAGLSTAWAILFFIMLITLGFDSEFALVETVTTAIEDVWPDQLRKKKGFVVLAVCIICYIIGLSLCTNGGSLLLGLMDSYSGGWNVLVLAILECISIGWVYGFQNFRRDIGVMIGKSPCCCVPWMGCSYIWGLLWCFITPLLCAAVVVFSLVRYTHPKDGDYYYPPWAEAIGWLFTLLVLSGIVITPIIEFCRGEKYRFSRSPEWGPALKKHRQLVLDAGYLPGFVLDPWGDEENQKNAEQYSPNGIEGADNPAYDNDQEKTNF